MESLAEWDQMEANPFRGQFDWSIKDTDAETIYRKERYGSNMYLIIDEKNSRGILYLH